jgi:hypothetical protein
MLDDMNSSNAACQASLENTVNSDAAASVITPIANGDNIAQRAEIEFSQPFKFGQESSAFQEFRIDFL